MLWPAAHRFQRLQAVSPGDPSVQLSRFDRFPALCLLPVVVCSSGTGESRAGHVLRTGHHLRGPVHSPMIATH